MMTTLRRAVPAMAVVALIGAAGAGPADAAAGHAHMAAGQASAAAGQPRAAGSAPRPWAG
jgi:hypothetical protein